MLRHSAADGRNNKKKEKGWSIHIEGSLQNVFKWIINWEINPAVIVNEVQPRCMTLAGEISDDSSYWCSRHLKSHNHREEIANKDSQFITEQTITNLANQSNQLSRAFWLNSLRSTAYYIWGHFGASVPLVVLNLLQLKTAVFCIESSQMWLIS